MRAERLLLHSTAPTPDATRRRSWARFERDLAAVVSTLDGEVLVLDVMGSAAYVQLRAKARRFRCEAVSNAFLPPQEQLDDAHISALLALGWRRPRLPRRPPWARRTSPAHSRRRRGLATSSAR